MVFYLTEAAVSRYDTTALTANTIKTSASSLYIITVAKRIIRRFLPEARTIKEHKYLTIFGAALHSPTLWHLNRRSVPAAFAIGLFMAFMPMPFQMVPAAAAAILFRANIIIAVALVWISNPVTLPPLFYFCYKVGTWLIGRPISNADFNFSWEWMSSKFSLIWQPFFLGCFTVATISAMIGYYGMQWLWRLHVVSEWEKRKEQRTKKRKAPTKRTKRKK